MTRTWIITAFFVSVASAFCLCVIFGKFVSPTPTQQKITSYSPQNNELLISPLKPHRAIFIQLSREERTVYDEPGMATLSEEGKKRLNAMVVLLASESNISGVRIVGYADRLGNLSYNERLSQARAENVQHYLIARGLTKARLADIRWIGSQSPTTDCSDQLDRNDLVECLRQDRRVEIEVDYQPNIEASR